METYTGYEIYSELKDNLEEYRELSDILSETDIHINSSKYETALNNATKKGDELLPLFNAQYIMVGTSAG